MDVRYQSEKASMANNSIWRTVIVWGAVLLQLLTFGCVSVRIAKSNYRNDSSSFSIHTFSPMTRSTLVRRIACASSNSIDDKLETNNQMSSIYGGAPHPFVQLSGLRRAETQSSDTSSIDESAPSLDENQQFSLFADFKQMPMRLKEDAEALLTPENTVVLGVFAGSAAVLRNNIDRRVIRETDEHGPQWGVVSVVLSHGGDAFLVHVPLLAGMYATSLWQQSEELHELTLTMFTSYKFSILSAVALQYATGTHRNTGSVFSLVKDNGFPSEPTAASFALAAVIDEKYGWKGGVPAYCVAGLIGWSEVDQNHHTVSDVAFGAALGYIIGKSIGALHYRPDSPVRLIPFVDTNSGSQGMAFEMRY
jgi:membrane-associated phospholipid phosphatase